MQSTSSPNIIIATEKRREHLCLYRFAPNQAPHLQSVTMATGVDAKLLKTTKFPPEFNQKVDMTKVNLQVMKKYVRASSLQPLEHDPEHTGGPHADLSRAKDGLQAKSRKFSARKTTSSSSSSST